MTEEEEKEIRQTARMLKETDGGMTKTLVQ